MNNKIVDCVLYNNSEHLTNSDHWTRSRWQAGLAWLDWISRYDQIYLDYYPSGIGFVATLPAGEYSSLPFERGRE